MKQNIKEKVLNDFAQRNQYSSWKEVVKDKQSMTFEAKEFEEEINEIFADVGRVIDEWFGKEDEDCGTIEELKEALGIE